MPQQQRVRTIVGSPMTPDLMSRIGGLDEFPVPADGFDPAGAWVHTYRVHTCHGYFEGGNVDRGLLRIERLPGDGETFRLKIHYKIVNDEGRTNLVDAVAECRQDAPASLIAWQLSSKFVDLEGERIAGLGCEESGTVNASGVEMRLGESILRRPASRSVTADWCLLEAVQRMPFTSGPSDPVDVLEGLRVVREEHRLSYRGRYRWMGQPPAPHWFQQIGFGVLPYEYWLDDDHRLLAVATHARAYILDPHANQRVERRFQEIYARKSRRTS